MSHLTLLPGQDFPQIQVATATGKTVDLRNLQSDKFKLVIFFRGKFCPFCNGNLAEVNKRLKDLNDAGIEVVAVSTDDKETAESFVKEAKLDFTIGYGLTVAQLKAAGVYVSNVKEFIPERAGKNELISEPAFFLLNKENKIGYLNYANNPMSGRVDVNNLLAGYNWVLQNKDKYPNFVRWGTVSI